MIKLLLITVENLDTPKRKGISVFDFDDTLAKTKEKVIVTIIHDGTTTELSAAQNSRSKLEDLEAEGATF